MYTGPNIITDGLVLYLDAANTKSYTSGSTTWNDLSGIGNNGTLTNGPTFSNANGGSIVFDGIDDYSTIDITNIPSLKIENFLFNNRTIEVWFNLSTQSPTLNDATENQQGLVVWPGYHNGIFIGASTIEVNCLWNSARSSQYGNSYSASFSPNTWYCVHDVIDYSNTVSSYYLNGLLVGSVNTKPLSTMISANGIPANRLNIGIARPTSTYRWRLNNGRISNVKLYNKAMNAAEILQNYNATKSRFNL